MIRGLRVMEWARVPKVWAGQRAYLIGGGPSAGTLGWEALRGRNVLACNAAAFLLPAGVAGYGLFSDHTFLSAFRPRLRRFVDQGGVLYYTPTPGRRLDDRNHWAQHLQRLNYRKNWGISDDPMVVRWNKSTGGCAMNLAYLLGARELVLIGYDMQAYAKRHNWHGEYEPFYGSAKHGWPERPPASWYRASGMILAIEEAGRQLAERGVRVWNANQDSALECFEKRPLEELL